MKRPIDYQLYLVSDRGAQTEVEFEQAIYDALAGGVTMLQLREKELDSKSFYEEALRIKKIVASFKVPLIINDRVDIALACDADGVHVGQADLPVKKVRQLIGPDKLIGASVQTLEEALLAAEEGADYLGVGAMFPTPTKPDAIVVPPSVLTEICQNVSLPIVLIGGINTKTIPTFRTYSVAGFAVVSAILAMENKKTASQQLLALINQK